MENASKLWTVIYRRLVHFFFFLHLEIGFVKSLNCKRILYEEVRAQRACSTRKLVLVSTLRSCSGGFAIVNSGINTRQSGESVVRSVVSQVPEEGAREGRVMTLTIDVIRRALFLDHCHRRTLISFLEPRTTRFDPDFFKKSERGGKKKRKDGIIVDRIF